MNALQTSVVSVESELGLNPRAGYASVAVAIAAMLPKAGGTLTGDVTADAGVKVDGVDISAHTHAGVAGDAANIPWSNVSDKPYRLNSVFASSVDGNGCANFISVGTGLSVNIDAAPMPVFMDIDGVIQKIEADTSISSLTASSLCYLYADKGSGSAPTLGHTTLKPVYSLTAPATPATDQCWFDLSAKCMMRYTGSVWEPKQRIFIGEATTDGSSVTAVVSYALRGIYDSSWFSVAANTQYTKTHNLGMPPLDIQLFGATADAPPANVHRVIFFNDGTNGKGGQVGAITELDLKLNASSGFDYPLFYLNTSATSGYYRVIARRGW